MSTLKYAALSKHLDRTVGESRNIRMSRREIFWHSSPKTFSTLNLRRKNKLHRFVRYSRLLNWKIWNLFNDHGWRCVKPNLTWPLTLRCPIGKETSGARSAVHGNLKSPISVKKLSWSFKKATIVFENLSVYCWLKLTSSHCDISYLLTKISTAN